MLVLLDECLPQRLRTHLVGYQVVTVGYMKWSSLTNGELLARMMEKGCSVLITVDQNLAKQQKNQKAGIAVIAIRARTNDINDLIPLVPQILRALEFLQPGQVVTVTAP